MVKYVGERRDDVILMDTQAGVEHFGRSLTEGFDHCLIITDDTYSAMSVATMTLKLSKEIGIKNNHLVFNRTSPGSPKIDRMRSILPAPLEECFDTIHYIPYEEMVREVEPNISEVVQQNNHRFTEAVAKIAEVISAYSAV